MTEDFRKMLMKEAEQQQEQLDDNFEAKIVRKILAVAGFDSSVARGLDRSGNLTLAAMAREFNEFPVHIIAARTCKLTAEDLFLRITKTDMWKVFWRLRKTYPGEKPMARIFRVHGLGVFAVHDWQYSDPVVGHTRLVRLTMDGKFVSVEKFDSFIEAAAPYWT